MYLASCKILHHFGMFCGLQNLLSMGLDGRANVVQCPDLKPSQLQMDYITSTLHTKWEWTKEIEVLSAFAGSPPQAAYACYTHRLSGRWTILCRTTPNIRKLFHPLDDAIRNKLLQALTVLPALSDVEHDLLANSFRGRLWHYEYCYIIPYLQKHLHSSCHESQQASYKLLLYYYFLYLTQRLRQMRGNLGE